MMDFRRYQSLARSDLYRVTGRISVGCLLKQLLWGESYKYIFWFRTCEYLRCGAFARYTLYPFARLILRHYSHQLGICIPVGIRIGPGFYIGHFGTIVVHPQTIIGRNCNLYQGVTTGISGRGEARGVPVLGDAVGVPARVISLEGSVAYQARTDY